MATTVVFEQMDPATGMDVFLSTTLQTGCAGGYIGAQIHQNSPTLFTDFALWDFDNTSNTRNVSGHCDRYDNEGHGTQCGFGSGAEHWLWELGTPYTFNLSVASSNASGATFNASLRNDKSGAVHAFGQIFTAVPTAGPGTTIPPQGFDCGRILVSAGFFQVDPPTPPPLPLPPLGRPLFHDPHRQGVDGLPAPSIDVVRQFHRDHFCGDNIVVSAAGLDHDEAVQLSEKYFGHLPKASASSAVNALRKEALVPNKYVGGCRLVDVPNLDFVHVGLGFETGGWHDDDLVPACVLVALLGGGDSFSAGGPGKGMYSRLYREVLNRCGWVESILGVSLIHTDTGCVGIVGSTEPQYAPSLYRVMCDQWLRAASEPVDDMALTRARNRLKSSVLMNLESRLVLGDDMARQVATYGKRESADAVCSRIDAVTTDDLMRVAQRGLKNGNPSVVAYGDLTHIPENIHDLVVQVLAQPSE